MTRKITPERLEYLLRNWGVWQRGLQGVGPVVPTRCGSAERKFAGDTGRYVWETSFSRCREAVEEPLLAERVEAVIAQLAQGYQQVLVMRFCRQFPLEGIAGQLRMSVVTCEARLDSAIVAIWEKLEATAWASGI